ncbi:MAG: cytochrome c [Hyphomicrobiales bacterium]|nr:cytochrome c [Hyphomicrobiales bacterium]
MNRSTFAIAACLSATLLVGAISLAHAKPVNYQLPDETAELKPGEHLDVVQGNCTACHSPDYIKTQPQGPSFKKSFWQAEVTKMIKVYGAPIEDADVAKIVDYLSTNY